MVFAGIAFLAVLFFFTFIYRLFIFCPNRWIAAFYAVKGVRRIE